MKKDGTRDIARTRRTQMEWILESEKTHRAMSWKGRIEKRDNA